MDDKDILKRMIEINSCVKKCYAQAHPDSIDNKNTVKEPLHSNKCHLNKRKNSASANNLLKYLRLSFWILEFLAVLGNCAQSMDLST